VTTSIVVTGGGRGIGRAIAELLLSSGHAVVIVERDADAVSWAVERRGGVPLSVVAGDAADEAVAERAADVAESSPRSTGG
jgi:NAD(P)-dependent dehydrogenase (short-subunit alcohol dehydrogenase family)